MQDEGPGARREKKKIRGIVKDCWVLRGALVVTRPGNERLEANIIKCKIRHCMSVFFDL